MAGAERCVEVEERQGDADGLRREPDLAADAAAPGQRAESVDQRERDVLPFRPLRLKPAEEAVEQRDVGGGEEEREGDVVEREAEQRHQRDHQQRGEWRKRDVPAAVLEHPVVQVRRPRDRQGELAVEERVGLVDEVGRERLVREEPIAGERVRSKRAEEEDQVDAVARHHLPPPHPQRVLDGPRASRSSWRAPNADCRRTVPRSPR